MNSKIPSGNDPLPSPHAPPSRTDHIGWICMAVIAFMGAATLAWAASLTAG